MKISELPKKVKEKALFYQINASKNWDKKTDNIFHAFPWGGTKEENYYWSNFHDKEFKHKKLIEKIYDTISKYLFGGINCNPKG